MMVVLLGNDGGGINKKHVESKRALCIKGDNMNCWALYME